MTSDPMPTFTFKAKDNYALAAVVYYRDRLAQDHLYEQAIEVDKAIEEILNWQNRNPDQMQDPDHKHEPTNWADPTVLGRRSNEDT